ncbi:hypothetical protein B9Z19DRAFT_1070315 [Tuber borchii]|uniref:Secreted protein n=1 Tax=Tuber borchii TaxID=42251 RepID=A0A2T7A9N0_TUBBO|nr:hypothetical protein B9Z19DRAFT_1070315 [Tuber borchii]
MLHWQHCIVCFYALSLLNHSFHCDECALVATHSHARLQWRDGKGEEERNAKRAKAQDRKRLANVLLSYQLFLISTHPRLQPH